MNLGPCLVHRPNERTQSQATPPHFRNVGRFKVGEGIYGID